MSPLFEPVRVALAAQPILKRLFVGYSGGVDSHVLLHLLATQRQALAERSVNAVYVDHGLHPQSAAWGAHCETVCRDLGVAFCQRRVVAAPLVGESPEAAARRARYGALEDLLDEHSALLTAHHLDDQAETLLLQLLRGGGLPGLAAMPASAPLGRGLLLRPLLNVERAVILGYAVAHRLRWIDDSSNEDPQIPRNYLRHEIMPRLQARWPAAARTLARSARLCAEAAALADAQGEADLAQVADVRSDCMNLAALRALSETRQRNVLRHWLRCLGLSAPSAAQLRHVLNDAVATGHDRQPCIRWPGTEVRRYRDRLFALSPLEPHDPTEVLPVTPDEPLRIAAIGQVMLRTTRGVGVRAAVLVGKPLSVRFRRGGERFHPMGRAHGQALKKLFQEAGLPPWERERVPLLYVGEELAAVAGLGTNVRFATPPDEIGLVLEWQKAPASGTV